jgi:hypothetical protein
VLAREYGFAGWKELREEVLKRAGKGLEWAVSEAQRAIHDNDVERLQALLAEHRGLLAWRDKEGRPLLQSTTLCAMDVSDPAREADFCRPACAAVLIDAGALVTPSVWNILIRSAAAGMMALLHEKKVLPRTLVVLAALGDQEGVRACLDEPQGGDRDAVNFAFMSACRFKREAVAATLLTRAIALDPKLGIEIDRWGDRAAFVADMIAHCPSLYGRRSLGSPSSYASCWTRGIRTTCRRSRAGLRARLGCSMSRTLLCRPSFLGWPLDSLIAKRSSVRCWSGTPLWCMHLRRRKSAPR